MGLDIFLQLVRGTEGEDRRAFRKRVIAELLAAPGNINKLQVTAGESPGTDPGRVLRKPDIADAGPRKGFRADDGRSLREDTFRGVIRKRIIRKGTIVYIPYIRRKADMIQE